MATNIHNSSFIIHHSAFILVCRPRGAVRSARHAVNVEIAGSNPVEGAEMARYANRHSGQAQTLVSVGSTPGRDTRLLHSASVTDGTAGSEPARRGSTPRRGTEQRTSSECDGASTRPCEGRRPGSTPGEDTDGRYQDRFLPSDVSPAVRNRTGCVGGTKTCDAGARRQGDRLQPG